MAADGHLGTTATWNDGAVAHNPCVSWAFLLSYMVIVMTLLLLVTVTDRKFAVKARLYQALAVTLAVVRTYLHSPKVLQSLVSVLKLYATDGQQMSSCCSYCYVSLTFFTLYSYAFCRSLSLLLLSVYCDAVIQFNSVQQ